MKKTVKNYPSIEIYNQLHVKGTTQLSPRTGYYLIQEIQERLVPNHPLPIKVATALWKQYKEETFHPSLVVQIQLMTFELNSFAGSDQLLESVLNKIIEVRRIYKDMTVPPNGKIVCNWNVITHTTAELEKDENMDYSEENAMDVVLDQLTENDYSISEIENAILDADQYLEEWDTYEANLYLDIEETQIKREQQKKTK